MGSTVEGNENGRASNATIGQFLSRSVKDSTSKNGCGRKGEKAVRHQKAQNGLATATTTTSTIRVGLILLIREQIGQTVREHKMERLLTF